MTNSLTTSISLPKPLHDDAAALAQRLNISPDELMAQALEAFIKTHAAQVPSDETKRAIRQGDVYWVQIDDPSGGGPGIPHPHVVIQDDILNHSRLKTVVVCALTSNLKRASLPGNILLDEGEANLPRHSVVEVSKVSSIEKAALGDHIGSLTEQRVHQILAGLRFLHASFFDR